LLICMYMYMYMYVYVQCTCMSISISTHSLFSFLFLSLSLSCFDSLPLSVSRLQTRALQFAKSVVHSFAIPPLSSLFLCFPPARTFFLNIGTGELKSGLWKCKLLQPPTRFNASLLDLNLMMSVPLLSMYCRSCVHRVYLCVCVGVCILVCVVNGGVVGCTCMALLIGFCERV